MNLVGRIVFEAFNGVALVCGGATMAIDFYLHSPWLSITIVIMVLLIALNTYRSFWRERQIAAQRELIASYRTKRSEP